MSKPSQNLTNTQAIPNSIVDDRTFYWEWFKHEENLFTNRGSFFLVAESMLFAAVATLRSTFQSSMNLSLLIFCGLGIFITVIWLGVNTFHHQWIRKKIQVKLNQFEPRRAEISGENSIWLKSHFWMGIMLPIGILISWLLLLIGPVLNMVGANTDAYMREVYETIGTGLPHATLQTKTQVFAERLVSFFARYPIARAGAASQGERQKLLKPELFLQELLLKRLVMNRVC